MEIVLGMNVDLIIDWLLLYLMLLFPMTSALHHRMYVHAYLYNS